MRSRFLALAGVILVAAALYLPTRMGAAAARPQSSVSSTTSNLLPLVQSSYASQAVSIYLPLVLKAYSAPASNGTHTPPSTSVPTLTHTPSGTPTLTPTSTETPTPSDTPTETATQAATPTSTETATPTSTETPTPSDTPTEAATQTATPTSTETETATSTFTWTDTPTETSTPSATSTSTPTDTLTETPSATASRTSTPSATWTATPTHTYTPSLTRTPTPSATRTGTFTRTYTPSVTRTPTRTATPTRTPTRTYTPSVTRTPTRTATPTRTPSPTYTPTLTATPTVTGTLSPTATFPPGTSFTFASLGDIHAQVTRFTQTINQVKTLNPTFLIVNGDYTTDGVYANDSNGQMNDSTSVLANAGLFNNAFIVRGNHDNTQSGSSANWDSFFTAKLGESRSLPAGVTNYVAMDAGSTYRSYSFDYGNSRFIGVDVPGDAKLLTSVEYTFMDARLTDAEALGLTHAFIYFHGPEYCMESIHCECTARSDASCTPTAFITLVNKHPIVSATFHGHEHALVHIHMDSTRLAALTHPYEEFLTSSAGMPYSFTTYANRVDDNYTSSSQMSFGLITVNGLSYTVSFYRVGTTAPVWTKTFTK